MNEKDFIAKLFAYIVLQRILRDGKRQRVRGTNSIASRLIAVDRVNYTSARV